MKIAKKNMKIDLTLLEVNTCDNVLIELTKRISKIGYRKKVYLVSVYLVCTIQIKSKRIINREHKKRYIMRSFMGLS